uniref:Uncharacterized protein n=1 Tax=Tanacetum cinerariifolium TaxID=118510 RepID=A0A699KUC2_TANCI|nr:hypothetical protein [Tanacetum cinerariifolium]
MSTYLRHMGGYKQSYLKGRSFDKIKEIFNREMRHVNDFVTIDSEAQKSSAKEAQKSSTKRTAEHIESDISKKQKVDENVEPIIDDNKELKKCIEIVPDDGDEKDQMRIDEEYARKLQAEEQKVVRLSSAQQDEEASNSWDNIKAMMDAD